MVKEKLQEELNFCLDLWEKQGHCSFGISTECKACAVPYLLYKLISQEVIHEKKLSLEEWKNLAEELV
jgi:hypothetical protein